MGRPGEGRGFSEGPPGDYPSDFGQEVVLRTCPPSFGTVGDIARDGLLFQGRSPRRLIEDPTPTLRCQLAAQRLSLQHLTDKIVRTHHWPVVTPSAQRTAALIQNLVGRPPQHMAFATLKALLAENEYIGDVYLDALISDIYLSRALCPHLEIHLEN